MLWHWFSVLSVVRITFLKVDEIYYNLAVTMVIVHIGYSIYISRPILLLDVGE
jgi:hypothetical protein